ncbi:MAG: hydroxymethylbilane synthase [Bacteroidetes bacterium]|nr:hydroxymethylbilane synthase [Bacteroidota bacterium]
MNNPLIIATRGSDLALWQAHHVKSLLEKNGLQAKLNIIKTQGDEIQHLSLDKLEGKGFFTKEIEDALLTKTADIAVHSHKDLPTEMHPDLIIAAVSDREDPSELLIIRKEAVDVKQKFSLKRNAIVGTSSARRKSQLLAFRKDVELKDLRGNVPTRIKKIRDGMYDAILIASAGVERLELDISDFNVEKLDPKEFLPAPAQGVLAIQVRRDAPELFKKLQGIMHNEQVSQTIAIERKVLNIFQGGCHAPVGVYAEYDEEQGLYRVRASKADTWDEIPVSVYLESKKPDGVAEKIVHRINHVKKTSVFITRNLKAESFFEYVLSAKGFKVEGKSLIEMVPVPFNNVPATDWIFFSSKHAVKFFFAQNPVITRQKFGCIGKATADMIRKYGQRADFIGYSTDTKLTGKQFASAVGDGTVLFPQAKGSLRSVQNGFVKTEQVTDLVVYETLYATPGPGRITDSEIVIFTSPSNVESFFRENKLSTEQKVIAMGEATGSALKKSGITRFSMPDSFEDTGLVRAVFTVSGQEQ